jgi:hypothetical protein
MKALLLLTILLNFITANTMAAPPIIDITKLKELDIDWELLSELEINELNQEKFRDRRVQNLERLSRAKQLIISGDVDSAFYYLNKVKGTNKSINFIKRRYLALIAFINDDYEKSKAYLESTSFNENKFYEKICVMKIINEMSLNNTKKLYYDFDNCLKITLKYTKNDHYWLTNLFNLKFQREKTFKGLTISDSLYVLQNMEFTKIWLKTGIYLNQENLLLRLIKSLPESYYRSKRIRELIGLLYFRVGDHKTAMSFIEDIETPNSENMKGNFNLRQKKYELAFGHYQLALKKKKNSLNALERSLPLVWLLSQWDKGYELLDRLIKEDLSEKKKLTLNSIFKLKQERFLETQKQLIILSILFKDELPIELEQMMVYTGIKLKDPKQYTKYSSNICRSMDGLGCWVMMQTLSWENIGKTIERDEEITTTTSLSVEDLKRKTRVNKIQELPTVDQQDIEELDSELIKISPGIDS